MKLNVIRLKEIEYGKGVDLQLAIMGMRQKNNIEDTIIFLRHPHVLTMGTSCREGSGNNLLVPMDDLVEKGVSIHRSSRGGNITYHGPGQIVGYPIIDLNNHDRAIRMYINKLEELFIRLLKERFEIEACRDNVHRGVWVDDKKITALGCSVKKWVTMHGFAFNVNTDMEYFKLINPCGILDKGVVSLKDLTGSNHNEKSMENLVLKYFFEVFGYNEIVEYGEDVEKLIGGFVK